MRRREFITLLGGTAAWPFVARAQQEIMPIIGQLHAGTAEANRDIVVAFEHGLKQQGFSKGQNLAIEYRWAEGRYDQLPALARELVDRPVTLILAGTPVAALAAKAATKSIPIIF